MDSKHSVSGPVPVIDISSLQDGSLVTSTRRQACIAQIGKACQEVGFFYIYNHGVCVKLQKRLEDVTKEFFALPRALKRKVEMALAGKTWRGYFEVGEELTSGVVDEKEGYYFGAEGSNKDERPLHGNIVFDIVFESLCDRYRLALPLGNRTPSCVCGGRTKLVSEREPRVQPGLGTRIPRCHHGCACTYCHAGV